jgi:lipopolysaccharide/colanic/teichoic acid biosynthesis glycosyltransferase
MRYLTFKTFLDVASSICLLIILAPLLIIISGLVYIVDGSPVFFVQDRVGEGRRLFKIIKFRTMEEDRETKLGRMLRLTGIDELPQLINIVRAEMSFVGPRPLTRQDIIRLGWDRSDHDVRWTVKPGITGMGQLVPVCDVDLTWSRDEYYIKNHSIRLDIRVLTTSAIVMMLGRKPLKKTKTG